MPDTSVTQCVVESENLIQYNDVVFTYLSKDNQRKTCVAEKASYIGAVFTSPPWKDLKEIKGLTFELEGFVFKASASDFTKDASVSSVNQGKYILRFKSIPFFHKCNRDAHRYLNVAFQYIDDKGIFRKTIAKDASACGAKFPNNPWENVKNPMEIKELTFELNGLKLKGTVIDAIEKNGNNPGYVLRYKSEPLVNLNLPNVLGKIEDLYSDIVKSLKKDQIAIPANWSRRIVILLLSGIIIGLFGCAPLMAIKFGVTQGPGVWLTGVFVVGALILSIVLCIFTLKSQKDLQEYAKNDRRLVIANYLEQVMITFSLIKDNNWEKAIDKLQKAGESILETTVR